MSSYLATFFVLFGVLLGSIFVDIDSSSSKVARRFWLFSWLFKHRGVIHSLFACLFLSSLVGMFNLWFGFGFFVGYISHLLIDCFTFAGIRIFWPLKFKVKGFVKSGGWVEDVLFVFLLVLNILFALHKFL